ncbi:MAG: hypothetical protein K8R69_12480 [Deltaproteobacteria bacterium]|nr:hypothetical protein [Deltaproteobacteria bacterium]
MSGALKSVPAGAEQIPSFQLFLDTCQGELNRRSQSTGVAKTTIDPTKVAIFNRSEGDGRFEALFEDPASDFSCAGQWLWQSRELLIRAGKRSDKTITPLGGGWISDACSATEKLAGPEEFSGETCQDGVTDPRLSGAEKFSSVKQFADGCTQLLGGKLFDMGHTRILNPIPRDGSYSLLFESRAKNLFCMGEVDANIHQMALSSGPLQNLENSHPSSMIEMTDACTMTQGLLGADELLQADCKDRTATERKRESYISYAFYGVANVIAITGAYKIGKRLWASKALGSLRGLPLVRNLCTGLLAYAAYDEFAGLFFDKDHPIRHYGKWVAGGAGLLVPEVAARTVIGQRVATALVGSRLAPIASRLTWGLAAVWALDLGVRHFVVGSDYNASLNSRVTDQVYHDDGLYDWGWKKCINPLSWLNKSRRVFRAVSPSAMEWAVGDLDNSDIREKIKAEYREVSKQAAALIETVLPAFLHSPNPVDINEAVDLLSKGPIELDEGEMLMEKTLDESGVAALRLEHEELSEEDVERFCRKLMMKRVQESAKALVFIDQPMNDWAREVFNADGTLKVQADPSGELPSQKLQRRWAAPKEDLAAPEKTEVTSEAYELAPPMKDMG